MSIKKSLRIILILSSIIPVVIVSVIAHSLLSKRLLNEQTSNLEKSSILNISGLEAMMKIHEKEISLLTYDSTLIGLAKEDNLASSSLTDKANQILQERKELNPYCRSLTLYNKERVPMASTDTNYTNPDTSLDLTLSYLLATKSPAIGISGITTYSRNPDLYGTIEIGYPILDELPNNPPIGYIVSSLHLSYFDSFLDSVTFGDTGYAILLNKNGDIMYHPNESLIGSNIYSPYLSSIIMDYNNGLIESSGTFKYAYDGDDEIYGYGVNSQLDWVLLVKQDVAEILSMANLILFILVLTCLILLLLIIIFASFLTTKFTEPIIDLRDVMRTASEGNLAVQSNIKSKNELGELSKSFNKMLHIIKSNYDDLESMHGQLLTKEEQLRNNYDHIEFLAYHDTLTDLPNKLAFLDYVNSSLINSHNSDKSHAVFFVDLDNFKIVNDTLGHEYGDLLLTYTAKILVSLGDNSMLARVGGDEFLIFRENLRSKDEAIEFAENIIDRFKNPIELEGEVLYVSMSVGIAVYPDNGISSNTLIKNADIAMYKSKASGKSKYTLFDSKMEEELNRNTNIIEILRSAIAKNDIYLQYQPQYELATNSIIGFEALMRIRCDQYGILDPEEFIPAAEESGLIMELSAWAIREACLFNKKLIDYGITPKHVSVNISSTQINRPGFIEFLSNLLVETGLKPEYLVLELTESTLVSSILDVAKLLRNLQKLGVKISLDDFGTGYSSLNYLTRMPINTLKIDKSFINNICTNDNDSHIAESIIRLAHNLKIQVVAEGVETTEQLMLLRKKKCDIVQGFIYSAPLNSDEFIELIKEE